MLLIEAFDHYIIFQMIIANKNITIQKELVL